MADISEIKELIADLESQVKKTAQTQSEAVKSTMEAHAARVEKLEKGEHLTDINAKLKELADAQAKTSEAFDKTFAEFKRVKEGIGALKKSTAEQFYETEGFAAMRDGKSRSSGKLEVKEIVRTTAQLTNDNPLVSVMTRQGVQVAPNRVPLVRDLLASGPTSESLIEYMREDVFTNNAGMVAEGALKPESNITFVKAGTSVRTMAHWIRASRQVLADVGFLRSHIDNRLVYGLDIKEDAQLLSGDGTGENLLGLIPQATTFTEALMTGVTTPQIIDRIMMAYIQVMQAEYAPTGIVMNTLDFAKLMLTKTSEGAYIYANPGNSPTPRIWGLNIVPSNSMVQGKFMVGAFAQAATVWDRQATTVEASTEDRDNFVKNMVTILAEKRIALEVTRPKSFVLANAVPA